MKAADIVKYIVWYATQQGIKLTTNRLVKFVYLADLYQARLKNGMTLTDFPWRFIHYGPYCGQVGKLIEDTALEGFICKETSDSKFSVNKEYNLFSCKDTDAEDLEEQFHIGVIGQLQEVIRKFGEDTPQLLDYVYFDTEPMKDAKSGDLLDFSKAKRPEIGKPVKLKKLSPNAIKLARDKIKMISEELKTDRERLIRDDKDTKKYKDESYYKFVKLLNGEELDVGLKGTVKSKMQQ